MSHTNSNNPTVTQRQDKLVDWLHKTKVASMKRMTHQFQVSRSTILRTLKQYGYCTSYNLNAAYYTLKDVPQFDESGLWTYRQIGFSKFGTLTETIVALVENAAAGMNVAELQDRLKTQVANLLSRLVQQGRLTPRTFRRRQVVYLAADLQQAERQYQRRQEIQAAAQPQDRLPAGLAVERVIQILRQMILTPETPPESLVRQLARRGVTVTAAEVRQVIEHYGLEKKRRRWP
jgi:hypothetical protein